MRRSSVHVCGPRELRGRTGRRVDHDGRVCMNVSVRKTRLLIASPIVCSCFQVGSRTLQQAIERHGLTSTEQIGARLRAGTNCGSCLPEIRKLLACRQA